MSFRSKPVGWRYESARHSLAAKGIKTRYMAMSDDAQMKLRKRVEGNSRLGGEIDENIGKLDERIGEIRREMDGLLPTRVERDRRDTGILGEEDKEKAEKWFKLEAKLKDAMRRRKNLIEVRKNYFVMKEEEVLQHTRKKVLPEQPTYGSVAWQEEMVKGIEEKKRSGEALSPQEGAFLDTEARRQLYDKGYKDVWTMSDERLKDALAREMDRDLFSDQGFKDFKGERRYGAYKDMSEEDVERFEKIFAENKRLKFIRDKSVKNIHAIHKVVGKGDSTATYTWGPSPGGKLNVNVYNIDIPQKGESVEQYKKRRDDDLKGALRHELTHAAQHRKLGFVEMSAVHDFHKSDYGQRLTEKNVRASAHSTSPLEKHAILSEGKLMGKSGKEYLRRGELLEQHIPRFKLSRLKLERVMKRTKPLREMEDVWKE